MEGRGGAEILRLCAGSQRPAAQAGQLGGAGGLQGVGEEMTLAEFAAHEVQCVQLLGGFNSLRDDLHVQVVAEANDGLKHRCIAAGGDGSGDELG